EGARGATERARDHDHGLRRCRYETHRAGTRRRGITDEADRFHPAARGNRHPGWTLPMTATILDVDDEPDLEALVTQKFRKQIRDGAIRFVFARDGLEALQSLEVMPDVDLVVSDINMPRMDGLTLLQKLQEADEKKSTVIVSAYGDMSNIRTAMNRGAFDFLTKPIDFADF